MSISRIHFYWFCIGKTVSFPSKVFDSCAFTNVKLRLADMSLPFKIETSLIHKTTAFNSFIINIKNSTIFKENALTDVFRQYINCTD